MITVEATTLEEAYTNAAATLECSVSQLDVKIFQVPSKGIFGLFKKKAIIVAAHKRAASVEKKEDIVPVEVQEAVYEEVVEEEPVQQRILNDTIMPISFVSDQDDDAYDDLKNGLEYTADYDDVYDEDYEDFTEVYEEEKIQKKDISSLVPEIEREINALFSATCFTIEKIVVSVYDEETLLLEFKGEDAALLIGKEGYRYKALSYMIFNWLNSKYEIQLRLEIAEFLKNQEESMARYLTNVYENIERDGRAQTKILDGVLVQIALKELRDRYPEKYVVIRSTKDGLKYIIVNDYHTH
jgi:spoIIIJ-associated protein